jgi:hypothetical protein
MAGAPQIEVADIFPRPDGRSWAQRSRSIVIATSATCPACSADQVFEEELFRRAKSLGLPVFFLLSAEPNEDILARHLAGENKYVFRADLSAIGVSRTPTILAVDGTGRVLAIRIGTIAPADQEKYVDELLLGTSTPLYVRIKNAEVMRYVARVPKYQVIELRSTKTPLPAGLQYRQIPVNELSIRAIHEISRDTAVFVDCNSVKSAMTCQNALLLLSNTWTPDHLFAIDLPTRASLIAGSR